MNSNILDQFSFDFKSALIDEIALEGLEGIGFDLLWRRIEKRISSPVTEKMKNRFWNYVVNCEYITCYQLPEPLPQYELKDRFDIVDEETGHLLDPEDYLDGPFEYCPVENDYGSCKYYNTRKNIPNIAIKGQPYEKVYETFKDTLVMVASLEERWRALVPHQPIVLLKDFSKVHYCLLELIGRSRENGQMSTGKTNIPKLIKDSKLLFYNRKFLEDMDAIKVVPVHQVLAGRGALVSLMLRLTRFHKPFLQNLPRRGKFLEVVNHLLKQPGYRDNVKQMITKGIFTSRYCKKLFRTQNVFAFENIPKLSQNKKYKEMTMKEIRLELPSDESSESDNETVDESLQCEYKVKVSLLRQAYKLILKAGIKGLSLTQIGQLLGVEFYTARTICRIFKTRNIIKEFFIDKGKQKIARYVAVAAASTAIDISYEKEKKKYFDLVKQISSVKAESNEPTVVNDSENEIPTKKPKLVKDEFTDIFDSSNIEKRITEVKYLDGYENVDQPLFASEKDPSLRQLKYANGILKMIIEKQVIMGYQTLNSWVSNSIQEALMDVRSLKVLLQKLSISGCIKLIKMYWPIHKKTCILLCAPHVQTNQQIIKEKYKEINLIALRTQRKKKDDTTLPTPVGDITRPVAMAVYPRYMKLQKLHETIMKFVYFNNEMHKPTSSPGFCTLTDLVPEFTVDFVLGSMNASAIIEINNKNFSTSLLQQKLREIPANLLKVFYTSYNLQNTWKQNLKYLAMLGLIQLIRQPNPINEESSVLTYEFYVNPRALIIDTTGQWPGSNIDKEALTRHYHFQTFDDVEAFWKDIYKISTNTEITLERTLRIRKSPVVAPVLKGEVSYDGYAQILGDRLGPCGFDASFHMERARSWAVCHNNLKQQALLRKALPAIKNPRTKVIRKHTKPITRKKVVVKRKNLERKPPIRRPRRTKLNANVRWTKDEDEIILLCIAAATIMSPSQGCYSIRNNSAREILTMYDPDKTAAICHKRAIYMEANTKMVYEKDCMINELKRHPEILKRYEDLLKVFRLQYSGNWSKIYPAARLKLLELVWILWHLVRSDSYNKKNPCIALSLEEFESKYTITSTTTHKNLYSYKTPFDAGPRVAAIKEGVILAVLAAYMQTSHEDAGQLIHGMFSPFPEQILRPAITQLRKCGAIAAKEKFMAAALVNFLTKDLVQSSYKIATNYQRRWICRLNSEFIESLMRSVDEEFSKSLIKGSSDINCILFELKCCNILDFECVTAPTITGATGSVVPDDQMSVADMIFKLKLKSGSLKWSSERKFQKVSDLYEDIDLEDHLNFLKRNSILEINENCDEDDIIIHMLTENKENGLTFEELLSATGFGVKDLVSKLRALESSHIIKRVGYYENIIVLTKFGKPWTMSLKDKHIIPTPWLTLDLNIDIHIFLKWSGSVLNKIFMSPGCSVAYISDELEFISMRATQEICNFWANCNCIYIKCLRCTQPDLFSENDDAIPELKDFNEYESVQNILIFPEKDAFLKFAKIRRKLLNDESTVNPSNIEYDDCKDM